MHKMQDQTNRHRKLKFLNVTEVYPVQIKINNIVIGIILINYFEIEKISYFRTQCPYNIIII